MLTNKALINTTAVCLLLFATSVLSAETFSGQCVGVSDGDTISIMRGGRAVKVRLEGIDCPERGQDFSSIAKKYTSSLAFGKIVSVKFKEYDQYGRIVGRVFVGGKDLSLELIKAGLAWHYKRYSSDSSLAQAEEKARTARKGLWVLPNPRPPWEQRHPQTSQSKSSRARELHGNVRSRVFHASRCTYYSCKNCIQPFSSSDEAIAAGYRPCRRCRP